MAEGLNLPLTMGALLGGSLIAVGLSAIVGFQVFLYFQLFPTDTLPYKALVMLLSSSAFSNIDRILQVAWIWITDTAHTICVCVTVWEYVGQHLTNPEKLQEIVPSYSVRMFIPRYSPVLIEELFQATIILTLIATLNVNLFYAWRIHKMSKYNWWLTGFIVRLVFVFLHVVFDEDRTWIMITVRDWATFNMNFKACKVAAWCISAATDVVISAARYYHLRGLKQGYIPTQELVDVVVVFTINDGLLTCVTVIVVLACLLTMPKNFVWMGIFFSLAKRGLLQLCTVRTESEELVSLSAQADGHALDPSLSIPQHVPAQSPGYQTLAYTIERSARDAFSAGFVFFGFIVEYTLPAGKFNEENDDVDCRGGGISPSYLRDLRASAAGSRRKDKGRNGKVIVLLIGVFEDFPIVMLQDSKHALKTFRNNLFTGYTDPEEEKKSEHEEEFDDIDDNGPSDAEELQTLINVQECLDAPLQAPGSFCKGCIALSADDHMRVQQFQEVDEEEFDGVLGTKLACRTLQSSEVHIGTWGPLLLGFVTPPMQPLFASAVASKEAKVPHFLQVSTGDGLNQLKKLAIGDFVIVWMENGLMVAQGLVLYNFDQVFAHCDL
ncbi:hypothetical protein DFH08DRAFT_964707 [Mycena albidolilacea]|uniref:DUF6534 domain-containing protein n=1 Tax=Mycena albidolilacea TaxID=1033008 RepID=A0AAD6ZSB4_9AGAR|nr:hypothetical protein DFH08DRAFT_964707 [Mycena albidolilacea]